MTHIISLLSMGISFHASSNLLYLNNIIKCITIITPGIKIVNIFNIKIIIVKLNYKTGDCNVIIFKKNVPFSSKSIL